MVQPPHRLVSESDEGPTRKMFFWTLRSRGRALLLFSRRMMLSRASSRAWSRSSRLPIVSRRGLLRSGRGLSRRPRSSYKCKFNVQY